MMPWAVGKYCCTESYKPFEALTYLVIQHQKKKITWIYITTALSRKSLKYWDSLTLLVVEARGLKSRVFWKPGSYLWQAYCQLFFLLLASLLLRTMCPRHPHLHDLCLSAVLVSKNDPPWARKALSAPHSITRCFSLRQLLYCGMKHKCFLKTSPLSHQILKRWMLKSWNLIKLITVLLHRGHSRVQFFFPLKMHQNKMGFGAIAHLCLGPSKVTYHTLCRIGAGCNYRHCKWQIMASNIVKRVRFCGHPERVLKTPSDRQTTFREPRCEMQRRSQR